VVVKSMMDVIYFPSLARAGSGNGSPAESEKRIE